MGYPKEELLNFIKQAKTHLVHLSFSETDFLRDLLQTVPLFAQEGDYYRWKHKSIQEYFAALFICRDSKNKQGEILRKIVAKNDVHFQNTLEICYDIDFLGFKNTLIYDFVNEFLTFYDSSYSEIDREQVKEEDIHLRKIMQFGRKIIFIPSLKILSLRSLKEEEKADGKDSLYGEPDYDDYSMVFEYCRREKIITRDSMPVFAMTFVDESYMLIIEEGNYFILSKVLSDKALNIWDHNLEQIFDQNFSDEHILGSGNELKSSNFGQDNQICIVNDDALSPLNSKENFVLVNELIQGFEAAGEWSFSTERCRVIRDSIKMDIELQDSGGSILNLI